MSYRYLLADSWYASAENMTLMRALGHHFLFTLESSRTVALSEADRAQGRFQAVQTLVFPATQPLRVYLRAVQQAVLVTKQVLPNQDGSLGMLYLVSSDTDTDLDLDLDQLTTIYQRRGRVEEYHKLLKQNASMGKSPTKTLATQVTHFFAAVLAYTKLEVIKLKCGIGHFRLKAQRYTVGLKAMCQQLALPRAYYQLISLPINIWTKLLTKAINLNTTWKPTYLSSFSVFTRPPHPSFLLPVLPFPATAVGLCRRFAR